MLLVCSSCRTRYVVADSAIGPAGRQVRCANCRHSWFQDGPKSVAPPQLDLPTPPPPPPVRAAEESGEGQSAGVSASPDPQADAAIDEPSEQDSGPSPGFAVFDRPPAAEPAANIPPTVPIAPYANDPVEDRSQFAHEPPFKPRRNPAKMMTYAAIAFALLVSLVGGGLWYSGWLNGSIGLTLEEPDLKIVLHDNLEQGRAADGTSYFIASGTIVNPTPEPQNVPDMLVTLTDAKGKPVYNWKMRAPVKSLAAGATADFSQLRRDIPLAATRIRVVWALDSK